jgi:hypothetical protein
MSLLWWRRRKSPKYWSDGETATLPNVSVMEKTIFLKVGRGGSTGLKTPLVFSFSMTRLIALEDFNTRILSASFKPYLVAVLLEQNIMEQSCRLLCTSPLTIKIGQITKLY